MKSTSRAQHLKEQTSINDFGYGVDDFNFIARLLHTEVGIHLPAGKASLVYSRLVKRLRALNIESFKQYCELVRSPQGHQERQVMISALTTNVTSFYRENHHFVDFHSRVLPRLLKQAAGNKRTSIWSAGCSSGQEPYSVALSILDAAPDARSRNLRILATDISDNVLEKAECGIYLADEIKGVPSKSLNAWFDKVDHEGEVGYAIDDACRGLVAFKKLNLIEQWPIRQPFDVIFCRNVVIYFNEETQIDIWDRMISLLKPGGTIYIGHSERISGPAEKLVRLAGPTTYIKNGAE